MNTPFARALPSLFVLTVLSFPLPPWGTPAPAGAQTGVISAEECRCVDAQGNEIENCRCFRMFDPQEFTFDFAPFQTSRARLGITLSVSLDEEDPSGARVAGVLEDGPADRAGIREGDVITHMDGRSLFDPLDDPEAEEALDLDESMPAQRLLRMARSLDPGDPVEIRYLRDGEPRTTTVEAQDLDEWGGSLALWSDEAAPRILYHRFQEEEPRVFSFEPGDRTFEIARGSLVSREGYLTTCPGSSQDRYRVVLGGECLGGLRTEKLNPRLGEYFATERGILVTDVHEDSQLGLQAGDVILRVGDREVDTPDRMRRIFRSYEPSEKVTLHIMRQKRPITVTGTLGR